MTGFEIRLVKQCRTIFIAIMVIMKNTQIVIEISSSLTFEKHCPGWMEAQGCDHEL